ncbi:MAG: TIGR00296 family protein [archaeon]
MLISDKDGKKLVKAARDCVASHFENKSFELNGFPGKLGVFVTIHSYPSQDLCGCIGFPDSVFSLNEGLVRAALAAAFQDPRFPPMKKEELDKVIFEVSVLTEPELVKVKSCDDYLGGIRVGEDGLIVDDGVSRGLLLPVVAVEYGWNAEEFLDHTCLKAFLPKDSWKDTRGCKVYKFQAQVFSEKKPGVV